jgi:hypothetical protein
MSGTELIGVPFVHNTYILKRNSLLFDHFSISEQSFPQLSSLSPERRRAEYPYEYRDEELDWLMDQGIVIPATDLNEESKFSSEELSKLNAHKDKTYEKLVNALKRQIKTIVGSQGKVSYKGNELHVAMKSGTLNILRSALAEHRYYDPDAWARSFVHILEPDTFGNSSLAFRKITDEAGMEHGYVDLDAWGKDTEHRIEQASNMNSEFKILMRLKLETERFHLKNAKLIVPMKVRLEALELRERYGWNTCPILPASQILNWSPPVKSVEAIDNKSDVLTIVLKKMPVIDDSVSWQQILEFRADTDSHGKLLALRRWITDVAKSNLSPIEIEEQLEWLMYDYERRMKLHKMKYKTGVLETIITTSLTFLENFVKFKWSEAAKSLFSLRHKRIDLMEAEINSPGAEVSYIVKAKEEFG